MSDAAAPLRREVESAFESLYRTLEDRRPALRARNAGASQLPAITMPSSSIHRGRSSAANVG